MDLISPVFFYDQPPTPPAGIAYPKTLDPLFSPSTLPGDPPLSLALTPLSPLAHVSQPIHHNPPDLLRLSSQQWQQGMDRR